MSLLAALNSLAEALLARPLHALADLLEKRGQYYYDEVTLKRWMLGGGGKAGNCEGCEGNADMGWIDMDDLFTEGDIDVDEPPLHPHCTCGVEYKDTRKRIYV